MSLVSQTSAAPGGRRLLIGLGVVALIVGVSLAPVGRQVLHAAS